MKLLFATTLAAFVLTGCNAMTNIADHTTKKQSSFSQDDNTIYPTIDGTQHGEPAEFSKQAF